MPRLYELLGKRIAHFRRRAGLTQEELAEKTGYSVDFIGLVERGINAPTVARLADIAEAVNVEVWQLFRAAEIQGSEDVKAHKKVTQSSRKRKG